MVPKPYTKSRRNRRVVHGNACICATRRIRIYAEGLKPTGNEQGHVLIVHCVGEHLGRHAYVAMELAQRGYAVTRFDLRGCGRSSGLRGHVDSFATYLDDIHAVLAEQKVSNTFLLGQSMGGLLAVLFALHYHSMVRGLVLCSPCLGLQMQPPGWKIALARIMSVIAPTLRLKSDLPLEGLSHNMEIAHAYRADPLCFDKVSTRWYVELIQSIDQAHAEAGHLSCPTLVMAGEADPIVNTSATQRFFNAIGSPAKRLVIYPKTYHEIFNEECRNHALAEAQNWLDTYK